MSRDWRLSPNNSTMPVPTTRDSTSLRYVPSQASNSSSIYSSYTSYSATSAASDASSVYGSKYTPELSRYSTTSEQMKPTSFNTAEYIPVTEKLKMRAAQGHSRSQSALPSLSASRADENTFRVPLDKGYGEIRSGLRPLSQAPNRKPSGPKIQPQLDLPVRSRTMTSENESTRTTNTARPLSYAEPSPQTSPSRHTNEARMAHFTAPVLSEIKTADLNNSSTKHLRNLSKFAGNEVNVAFMAPTQAVVGLGNRRQLKRNDSVRASKPGAGRSGPTPMFSGYNWMEKQRQFLQAYEYLCHVGEAKEWIERVIEKPIPPVVKLEETLRDGVTLAELVQAFEPGQTIRIFQHPKLQYRHSDNIAVFFRFLNEVGLPELFHFELVDLYEKKNIPKVIHCIHALSWLLLKLGKSSIRISNLVGQLRFEDHELEETQRGLDRAGVSMPTFSGMGESFGAEPEPEPEETEEERVERELSEHVDSIVDLQSQIRGALIRVELGWMWEDFMGANDSVTALQARIRGGLQRQVARYHLNRRKFAVALQSAARGHLVRKQQQQAQSFRTTVEPSIIALQNLIRAKETRQAVKELKQDFRAQQSTIRALQAAIRGSAIRKETTRQVNHVHMVKGVAQLQAAIRGRRQRHETKLCAVEVKHQQSSIRALQALIRGKQTREDVQLVREDLRHTSSEVLALQSEIRGGLLRKSVANTLSELDSRTKSIQAFQACVRGAFLREDLADLRNELNQHLPGIVALQAILTAGFVRREIGLGLGELEDVEDLIEQTQARIRGALVRRKFAEKRRFYRENMDKVIKVQSFVRAKLQGKAYKNLMSGKNPPVSTVKGFVHLLNDNDLDFDEEIESERLRKAVVEHVHANDELDQYISQMDIKIALLVKNKITMDELLKHKKHFGPISLSASGGAHSAHSFDFKALNKDSRRKLEHYQELFFTLQTQPQYIARLLKRCREQNLPEAENEKVKNLVMTMFGYAQRRREEFYLLKVLTKAMQEEVLNVPSLDAYRRGKFLWQKVFNAASRSPRDRKYLRDVFGNIIRKEVLENDDLDLESDMVRIYEKSIENEQLRTGQTRRNPTISIENALADEETKRVFVANLQDLRELCNMILVEWSNTLTRLPYSIRYLCQQMFDALAERFSDEPEGKIVGMVASWLWKTYLSPGLLSPDKNGIVDRGVSSGQSKNLASVNLVMSQIFAGQPFSSDPDSEGVFLQPLNPYIEEVVQRIEGHLAELINVPSAEEYYGNDEYNDLYSKKKPTLYIKMSDIFAVHQLIASNISGITSNQDEALREIVQDLGNVKSNEAQLASTSSSEVCLTLSPKMHDFQDPYADLRALFMETKRCMLYIIRIQSGDDLQEILTKPVTAEDEVKWNSLIQEELSQDKGKRSAYAEVKTAIDISVLSLADLKCIAIQNIIQLEQAGKLSRTNKFQDLLNDIALDIRGKHKRRIQRQQEIETTRMTIARLDEQAQYLNQQLKTYDSYIEQGLNTLHNKRGKKRFLIPFTKQWEHERELERSGRIPKFGSYKYSIRELSNRGVVNSWQGYAEHTWNSLDLTISCNEIGKFIVEGSSGSISVPGATASISLDQLLEMQYNSNKFLELFLTANRPGTGLSLSVNSFLHLIMKKFYKSE